MRHRLLAGDLALPPGRTLAYTARHARQASVEESSARENCRAAQRARIETFLKQHGGPGRIDPHALD